MKSNDRNPKSGQPGFLQSGFTARDWFALAVGLFLGLSLLKFGNPVILDSKIAHPRGVAELWYYTWPPSWSVWFLAGLGIWGGFLAFTQRCRWPASRWLWILPLIWFGWQVVSASRTVDAALTSLTVWHFGGVIVCYFLGALILANDRAMRLLLIGLLAGFTFSLVRAANQKLIEFPSEVRFLVESERQGWTNLPPEMLLELKQQGTIMTTNGVDIANPVIVKKFERGRVFGTLVYPNALAGAILLLLPVSLVLAVNGTRRFRAMTRWVAIGLTLFLGLGGLYWTGSKSGWLIAMAMGGIALFRLNWPKRFKWVALGLVLLLGLGFFAWRFQNYFAAGATSVGARFDYWRAAVQTTWTYPLTGTGPGTFQRPYERIKAPEAEMARLTHNDYLEQFSDSGFIGGLAYLAWCVGLVLALGRLLSKLHDMLPVGISLGVLGWLMQGLTEFTLYVPALAWTAFLLAGCLINGVGNQIDNKRIGG